MDWSKVYKPSAALKESTKVKELLEKLSKTKPYKDAEETEIEEDYVLLRIRIQEEIKKYEEASENREAAVISSPEKIVDIEE